MLYRCLVSQVGSADEVPIFFESQCDQPYRTLESALQAFWRCELGSLLIMNLVDEYELVARHAIGPSTDGDVRLFESGIDGGRPTYLDPAKCLAYVSPATLARLAAARRRLAVRRPELVA